jgi:hypothetical protein
MNHKIFTIYSILLAIAITLSGCASGATPVTSPDPLACPTTSPQECPAVELQAPVVNEWRWGYTKDLSNVIITFDPGDKCSMELIEPTDGNALAYEIIVNDQTYQNYIVAILSLEEGKGIEDIEAYHAEGGVSNQNPPPFSNLEGMEIVYPMSRTFHAVRAITSPLYFICLVQGPGDQRVIEEFDGIEISGY